MKSPAAYYLLLLYAVAFCKPFLPYVTDVLAHSFWAARHLETVHHQQGSQHVHDELKEAATQDANDSAPTESKTTEPVAVHLITQYQFQFSCTPNRVQNVFFTFSVFKDACLEKHTPPPKSGTLLGC